MTRYDPRVTKYQLVPLLALVALSASACGPKIDPNALYRRLAVPDARTSVPLPFTGNASGLSFSAGASVLYATWYDGKDARTASLRIARFDGQKWTKPATIATNVGVAANGREAHVFEMPDKVVVRWFDPSADRPSVRISVSHDGGDTWAAPSSLDPAIGAGEQAFRWLDDGRASGSFVWLAPVTTLPNHPPETTAQFVSPDDYGGVRSVLIVGQNVLDAAALSGASTSFGYLLAFREGYVVGSTEKGEDIVRAVAIDHAGHIDDKGMSEHDPWHLPLDARGIGPVVSARGMNAAVAYYTEIAGQDWMRVFFSTNGGRDFWGVKFTVPARISELRGSMEDGSTLVLAWVEDGKIMARRFRALSRTLLPGPEALLEDVRTSGEIRVLFDGTAGNRDYLAWDACGKVEIVSIPTEAASEPAASAN